MKELHMDLSVDSIINYPQSFNSFRDTARLYYAYEAYEILCSNNLLRNKFEFQEYLVENEATYSVGLQREIMKEINNMQNSAKELNSHIGCIFHFSIYICAFSIKGENIQLDNETCHAIQGVIGECTCNDNFA